MKNDISIYGEFVEDLAKDGEEILGEVTAENMHLLHMAIGMSGEVGELLDPIVLSEDWAEFDRENMLEELGDYEFYLEGFRQGIGVSRESIVCDLVFSADVDHSYLDHFEYVAGMLKACVLALSSYTASILDLVKKHVIYQQDFNQNSAIEYLKEIDYFLQMMRQALRLTRSDVLDFNMEKLMVRYSKGYSDQQAKDRADKE